MMTFNEFQASKRESNDLGAELEDCRWEDEPPAKGLVYNGELYIEQVGDHWPEKTKALGKWNLIIGRDEWISDDLDTLERRLYDFAVSEELV